MNQVQPDLVNFDPGIAYFSMEIGLETGLFTYSGGLGVLAGDTLKSCADLGLPVVGVSLLYHQGYFSQSINDKGEQVESPIEWNPADKLKLLPSKIVVREIQGRDVSVQGWLYVYTGLDGHRVPIIFLDSQLPENDEQDRALTSSLYAGDQEFRLRQEILLGIGGVKYLRAVGCHKIHTFHMNEGHSALLTLELLRESQRNVLETWDEDTVWDFEKVKNQCVFTTHTPVAAGHDKFPYDLVEKTLNVNIPIKALKKIGGEEDLNMTTLGLNLSRFANGVAQMHGDVSRNMFPGRDIDFITNGIHVPTWTHTAFKKLYDRSIRLWAKDPKYLRHAMNLPPADIWAAHMDSKTNLMEEIARTTGEKFDPEILTLGFARRAAAYKRATLMFNDLDRLIEIAENCDGLQLVFAGKSHPQDQAGKGLIRDIHQFNDEIKRRSKKLKLVYLPDYNMRLGYLITGGVDVWVNTPLRPHEASGTSGMKAALNGVLNLSILDGWWVEGCLEGITGWAIGDVDPRSDLDREALDRYDAESLYGKLESIVVPTYYQNRERWIQMQGYAIGVNASFFNTHRQMEQYVCKAYFIR